MYAMKYKSARQNSNIALESLRDTTDSTDALIYEYDKKISDLQSREDYIRCADLTKEICESARNFENELFDNKKQRIVPYIIAAATAILGRLGGCFSVCWNS